jgi:Immunity protein family (Imm11)
VTDGGAAEAEGTMEISLLSHCLDEGYPTVNWSRHAGMADMWIHIDDRHKAGQAVTDLLDSIAYRLRLNRRWPRVDCVSMVPGLAISARAKATFEELGVPGMRFLKFQINGEPFFLFYTERRIDCLDRTRAKIRFFSSSPDQVMEVLGYAFIENRLQARDVFTVPELSDRMFFWSQQTFFTKLARDAIERSKLVGFRFEDLPR